MPRTMYVQVAFDGTEFHGWQRQANLRTVQGVLEECLRRVVRHDLALHGCGRTDAGVHAAGYVCSFETACELDADRLARAVQSRLPEDLAILYVLEAAAEFHARRSAISKLYRYRIHNSRYRPSARQAQRYTYHVWHRLNVDTMREAANHMIGEKDFSAMAAKGCVRQTMVRSVLCCDVERHLDEVRIDVEGTGFLYNQVRNMVGTLINVGRGLWQADRVEDILASQDRGQAGPTAPARGLCLQWVRYPPEQLRPPVPLRMGASDTSAPRPETTEHS